MRNYFFYSCLTVVLAVLPSLHSISGLEIYNEKRLFQAVLLMLSGLFFLTRRYWSSEGSTSGRGMPYTEKKFQWGIILFIIFGLFSLISNQGWYYGIQELSLYILLLVLMIYTTNAYLKRPVQFEKGIGLLLLLFGGLYTLKFLMGYSMHMFIDYPLWPGERYQNQFFGFSNVRFFNQIQVWTLPLFVGFVSFTSSDNRVGSQFNRERSIFYMSAWRSAGSRIGFRLLTSYFFLFCAALWWSLIIQAGGRGATLCLLIAPAICLHFYKQNYHIYVKRYLISFGGGVLLKLIFFDLLAGGGMSKSLARSGNGRLDMWPATFRSIMENPWLGHGPLQFADIGTGFKPAHPHNSLLQLAYEFGIPAMLIAMSLVLWGLYCWFQKVRSDTEAGIPANKNRINIGISTSLLAGLGYSLFSGVIVMPLSQLWMVVIGGWALGIYLKDQNGSKKIEVSTIRVWFTKAVVAGAVVFLSYSLIKEVPKLRQNQIQYQQYGGNYWPRFWQQGKIGLKEPNKTSEGDGN